MKIMKESDFQVKVTGLIGGMPESGKTTLSATMLDDDSMLPALVVVMDGSEIVLKRFVGPKFDVVQGSDFEVLEEVITLLDNPGCKYKSVYFDNITHMHRLMLERSANERGLEVKKGTRTKFKYEQADYGFARTAMLYLADSVLKHHKRFNIFFTCWATSYKSDDNPTGNLELDLAGKLVNEMSGLFNLVGALKRDFVKDPNDPKQRIAKLNLYTQPTHQIEWVRNKGNLLPSIVSNPNLAEIRKVMLSKSV